MKKIAVTGGSGGAGHFVIRELLAHGYQCLNLDIAPPEEEICRFIKTDLTDYTAVYEAMNGCDALVHYAGMPHPDNDHFGAAERFSNNTVALFNAFNAAAAHGMKRVVWASSETISGFPFEKNKPPYVPVDETTPMAPQNGYAVSKAASERVAELMADLHDMAFVGLRLSNVLYDDESAVPSFQKIPGYWADPGHRKFNLWGYVDARDAAVAARLGLESDISGAESFFIAARDTIMKQPTAELMAKVMPDVETRAGLTGRTALTDCHKAQVMLGWNPQYTWADVLGLNEDGTSREEKP